MAGIITEEDAQSEHYGRTYDRNGNPVFFPFLSDFSSFFRFGKQERKCTGAYKRRILEMVLSVCHVCVGSKPSCMQRHIPTGRRVYGMWVILWSYGRRGPVQPEQFLL